MMRLTIVAAVVFLVAAAAAAPMWGDEGHEITALVAMSLIGSSVSDSVSSILGGQTLEEVSTWADSVKHQPGYQWSESLHFVDTPDWACDYQESYCNDACVVDAVLNYTKRVTTQTGEQQTEALKFLTHFCGDIHQPLHVAFASDRGGNEITGTYSGNGQNLNTNLHMIWDISIIEQRMAVDFGGSVDSYAQYLINQVNGTWASMASAWVKCQSGSFPCPDEWASATASLACTNAYKDQNGNVIQSGFDLGDEYYNFNSQIVDQQLAAGGVRLAAILNQLFSSRTSLD